MTLKKGECSYPGVDDEVAIVQARNTIKGVVDAIVELVTNCDDSYLGIEQAGGSPSGEIDIHVQRLKGSKLKRLTVTDKAAGIPPEKVERIVVFGKKTSVIYEGKSVRGFLGRGLKESILAIGEGEITTVADGVRTHGKYYFDSKSRKLAWLTLDAGSKTEEPSGTSVTIAPLSGRLVDCQTFETLEKRIQNHFALRDIVSNPKRQVRLSVEKVGQRNPKTDGPTPVKYKPPSGQQIVNEKLYLKGFGVAHLTLYEAPERLEYVRNDPGSQAGILIRTQNAILDNQLFGNDRDPDAHYFFGEVRCPNISERIGAGEDGIVKSDRTGMDWRNEHCKELEKAVRKYLEHHIERKKQQARSQRKHEAMPKEREDRFRHLFRKLNELSRELIAETGPAVDIELGKRDVSRLMVFPVEGGAPPGESRSYTVYNLYDSVKESSQVHVLLDDPRGKFKLAGSPVALKRHKRQRDLAIGHFTIKGYRSGDKTGIIAKQGADEDYAEFVVRPQTKSTRQGGKKPPGERRGGLFKEIKFDGTDEAPRQRVYYDRKVGSITIYLNYPGISPFLKAKGDGSETERGGMLLSELVGEAFCKVTARRKVESGGYDPESRLDQYLRIYDDHLKLCIPIIHKVWVT